MSCVYRILLVSSLLFPMIRGTSFCEYDNGHFPSNSLCNALNKNSLTSKICEDDDIDFQLCPTNLLPSSTTYEGYLSSSTALTDNNVSEEISTLTSSESSTLYLRLDSSTRLTTEELLENNKNEKIESSTTLESSYNNIQRDVETKEITFTSSPKTTRQTKDITSGENIRLMGDVIIPYIPPTVKSKPKFTNFYTIKDRWFRVLLRKKCREQMYKSLCNSYYLL